MNLPPTTLIMLAIVWVISLVSGYQFIRNALRDQRKRQDKTRLHLVMNEARFRLRLAAGLGLILWVVSGVVWVLTH